MANHELVVSGNSEANILPPAPPSDLLLPADFLPRKEDAPAIPQAWLRWPMEKRPPLIRTEKGYALHKFWTDFDGSFVVEEFPPHLYEQLIRAEDMLKPGAEVFSTLKKTRLNNGVPIMNVITGRSVPEMRQITRSIGDSEDDSFVIGGDGSDFSPPAWMWPFVNERMEQIEAAGFRKVTLQDGSDILVHSDTTTDRIESVLKDYEQWRDLCGTPTRLISSLDNLDEVGVKINEAVQHGDVETSKLSAMRGSSAYCIIESDEQRQQLLSFVQMYGLRAQQSPHVASVLEIHGKETGKDTAFAGYIRLMDILLQDTDGVNRTGMSITFGGNRGNDVKAANYLAAQHEAGAIQARVIFFPKENGELFVDPRELHPMVEQAPAPAAYGWSKILPHEMHRLAA